MEPGENGVVQLLGVPPLGQSTPKSQNEMNISQELRSPAV